MDTSTLRVLFVIFTIAVGSTHGENAGDVQQHDAQRRQSPINFGFRIIDEISDSVTQSLQGLLGVTQPGRPQRMPKTPSRFVHFNPASVLSARHPPPPPSLPQTSQFPQFPTPHPALVAQPTHGAISSGHSVQSQPQIGFVATHPASVQPNSVSHEHFNVQSPLHSSVVQFGSHNNAFHHQNSATPIQFHHPPASPQLLPNSVGHAQVVSPNSILQQSAQFPQDSALKPGLQSTFSSAKLLSQSPISHGVGKSQSSVQQNGVNFIASTAKPSLSLTNETSTDVGAQLFTEASFTELESLLQLQPPNVETKTPDFGFQDLVSTQTAINPQISSTIPQVNQQVSAPSLTGSSNQNIKNILPVSSVHENVLSVHTGSISPDVLRGNFSTFTNAKTPGLVLKIPNSMLLENFAKDKRAIHNAAGKAIVQTSDSLKEHHHHHFHESNHSHSQEDLQTNDDSALTSEKLLSQFLSTNNEKSNIPTEALIHSSTSSSHGDTESLSFKEPHKNLKQELHFGGWVGVHQEKTGNTASSSNIDPSLGFITSGGPAPAQSFIGHQSVNLEPIFIPPTQLIPPHRDLKPTSAGTLGKDLIKNNPRHSPKNNGNQSFERPHSQVISQEKQTLKKQNFPSAFDFLQKGSLTNKNSQNNAVNQKIMTILRPHVQSQNPKLSTVLDPAVFGIFQTLQPPDHENSFRELRTSLKNSGEESFTITLADEPDPQSLEALLLDDSTVELEHDDDTGTLSFTQVIDNANPAQVEQAQQLITAIPTINVSQLLHSDINSTHAYDTELTLKSLLSFRKKPRRIQSFEGQVGFLQGIPNHLSSSVQLNTFVTPPSIEVSDFSILNDFHNKQGLKLSPSLDLHKSLSFNSKFIPHIESSLNRSKYLSSNERKKRHETRFHKINSDSFNIASQDDVWRVNQQSLSVPRLPSTSMSPPPLPHSSNSFPSVPFLGLRAPDQFQAQVLPNIPQTISPLLELSNTPLLNNSHTHASVNGVHREDGKQLLVPSVILQPPLRGASLRITPKPEHQFGTVIHDVHKVNFGTAAKTTLVSVPLQSNDQSNHFLPPISSAVSTNAHGQIKINEQGTSNQNPLFQGQLANFPTIIVSQHQRPIQPQLPGTSQNPFQNAHFNQVHNQQVAQQQPSSQQNQFRQDAFSSTQNNPIQHNSANNVIKTEIISHQSGTHGAAFDFLNDPSLVIHQIPVSLAQTAIPRSNNFHNFQNNINNNQNVDLKRVITGVGGQFSQNVGAFNRQKSIGGNSITVHDSSHIRNILRESQLVENEDNVTNSKGTAAIGFSPSTSQQHDNLNQFRQQTFLHRVTPFKSTTISPIPNQLLLPERENIQNPFQFEAQLNTFPSQVTRRSFISTSTSFPRFIPVGSGVDIKTSLSSIPGLTTNTELDKIETNRGNDELSNLSTTVAPWSRRFRGRFMSTTPSSTLVTTIDQNLDSNSNTTFTVRPQNNFGLPFTPWPTRVEHGKRLTTTSTTTEATTITPEAKNFKSELSWPRFRSRFSSTTTTTSQPTVTSTIPPEKSTTASIFDTWLRTHQLTTTLPPSFRELTAGPISGNSSLQKEIPQPQNTETFKPQTLNQKRRQTSPRFRKRPSSRPGVPEYIAQETKVRPVSLPPSSNQPDDSSVDAEISETEPSTTTEAPANGAEIVTMLTANTNETHELDDNDFSNEDFIFISTKTS
ncbi:hypothetical protein FHG87_002583 [Trinorchestia longiramus]|nr:hypothetical protein FHG87_002583 [Trinorchestia longiramus]